MKAERGVEFASLSQHSDAVEVVLAGPDGTAERVEASYVTAGDGSHSPVLAAAGGDRDGGRLREWLDRCLTTAPP